MGRARQSATAGVGPLSRPSFKMVQPKLPKSNTLSRGMREAGVSSSFAYHPPTKEVFSIAKLHRPKGGKGPHN